MKGSWRHQCLLLTLLAFVLLSEGSRLPKEYWEQMLPKKLPSPSSSPSKGTNAVSPSSSSTTKNDGLPTSDGKETRRVELGLTKSSKCSPLQILPLE
ncbi:unnamed protein product [Sphenostylis stenocarpa]|uniref:Uncharacterized protein n=1 Tax=Sphenostylis stenocarpa TaxID=92480 RepID=A0AA86SW24_9FABA|nr:unnamed protein product [Sphenostylis stenocarpa]